MAFETELSLAQFKEQNPAYASIPDADLVDHLHQKYYRSVPINEFSKAIGYEIPDKPFSDDAAAAAHQFAGGVNVDFNKAVGNATQAFAPEDSAASRWGKGVVERADARAKDYTLDMDGRGMLAEMAAKGARAIPLSLASLPAYAAGPVVGGLATTALFGGSQYQEEKDRMLAAGASEEDAHNAGLATGAVSGIGEVASNYLSLGMLGVGRKAVADTMGGLIGKTTDNSILKPLGTAYAKALVGENLTENAQGLGTEAIERDYGYGQQDYGDIAVETTKATTGLTALLAPLGLAGHYRNSQQAQAIDTLLADPASGSKDERLAVVDMLHKKATDLGIPEADSWLTAAKLDVNSNSPIRRDAQVSVSDIGKATTVDDAIAAAGNAVNAATPAQRDRNTENKLNLTNGLPASEGVDAAIANSANALNIDNIGLASKSARDAQLERLIELDAANKGNRSSGYLTPIEKQEYISLRQQLEIPPIEGEFLGKENAVGQPNHIAGAIEGDSIEGEVLRTQNQLGEQLKLGQAGRIENKTLGGLLSHEKEKTQTETGYARLSDGSVIPNDSGFRPDADGQSGAGLTGDATGLPAGEQRTEGQDVRDTGWGAPEKLKQPADAIPSTTTENINGDKTSEKANAETRQERLLEPKAPEQSGAFVPTHELNDGTPVIQTGEDTFVDENNDEWQANDAMPIVSKTETGKEEVAAISGDKINHEWTKFADDSGSLGIPRAEMPQVKAEHRGALVNFLNARDISHEQVDVPASELKPTQAEFSPSKVKKAKEYEGGDRSILISSDNHVVDGHHQWMAKLDSGESVKAIRLHAPIKTILEDVKAFPSSEVSDGATKTKEPLSTTAKADNSNQDPILSTNQKAWVKAQLKERKIKIGSPGYKAKHEELNAEYETELDKALAHAPFDVYAAHPSNKGASENILKSSHDSLRGEYGVVEQNPILSNSTELKGETEKAPVEPSQDAPQSEWDKYEAGYDSFYGKDKPFENPEPKSIEQQKADREAEKIDEQVKSFKLLPATVKRGADFATNTNDRKESGGYVDGGYANEQDKKDHAAYENFKKTAKPKQLRSLSDYESHIRKAASTESTSPNKQEATKQKIETPTWWQEKKLAERIKSVTSVDGKYSAWDNLDTETQHALNDKFGGESSTAKADSTESNHSQDKPNNIDTLIASINESFPSETIASSWSGISHATGSHARSEKEDLIKTVKAFHDEALPFAETDAQKDALFNSLTQFKDDYLSGTLRVAKVRSGTYSSFVAGRSKFNHKQANQRGSAYDKANEAFSKWYNSVQGSVKQAVLNARNKDQLDVERSAKEAKQKEKDDKLASMIDSYLNFKTGDNIRFGHYPIKKVTRDKKGYPVSIVVDATDLTDNKFDIAKILLGGNKDKLRAIVDKIRSEDKLSSDNPATEEESKIESVPPKEIKSIDKENVNNKNNADSFTASTNEPTPTETSTIENKSKEVSPVDLEKQPEAEVTVEPKPEPVSATDKPYTLESHKAISDRIDSGDITADELLADFDRLVAAKDEIKAGLNKLTKAELKNNYRIGYMYGDSKKANYVEDAYKGMLHDYKISDELVSYGGGFIGSGISSMADSHTNAVRKMVAATTDADLASYAERLAKAKADHDEYKAKALAGMDNPETIDDYARIIRSKLESKKAEGKTHNQAYTEARMEFTPEQREKFDELAVEETRAPRLAKADQRRTEVNVAAQTTGGKIVEGIHTKHGYPIWSVQLNDRVDSDSYKVLASTVKRMGGNYVNPVRAKMYKTVEGFQFKDLDSATAFLELASGDADSAKEVVKANRDAYADDRSQTAAERLNEMADRLDEKADESLGRDRKANTSKRASEAARAESNAQADKAMAQTMRNIANAIDKGDAKLLDRVRQKTQVEMLQSFVHVAQYDKIRKLYPEYADQQKRQGEKPDKETADYAEWPSYQVYRSNIASLGRSLLEVDDTKKLGQQIMKVADDTSEAYLKFAKANLQKVSTYSLNGGADAANFSSKPDAEKAIARSGFNGKAIVLAVKRGENRIILSPSEAINRGIWEGDDKLITLGNDLGAELVEKIGKVNRRGSRISVPWQFENAYEKRKRLSAMGIETPAELRVALREFIDLREAPKEADKIKEMERAMVGRANDGLDFFPTPAGIADEMIEAADIKEGMTVLEPSAGMGHIAERIRATGVEPDVVEMSNSRKELLEAKGFNVVGRDFMDYNEKKYDRVILNPPFSDRRDQEHVKHAYDLLEPNGRLVAIMGEGVFFGSDKKAQEFRDWLEEVGGTEEKLAEGSFLDSSLPVNTGVNARMVVISKPESSVELSNSPELKNKIDAYESFVSCIKS